MKTFPVNNGHAAALPEPSVSPASSVPAPAIKTALLPIAASKFLQKEILGREIGHLGIIYVVKKSYDAH